MELERGRSVVICTYQRAASLLRCLGSLQGQLRSSDELLIVDASDGASTEDAIRAQASRIRSERRSAIFA